MPQSLTNLLVHLVFSTKNRKRLLDAQIRPEFYAYCGGILRDLESPALAIGGTDDHIHILCGLSKKLAPCKLVEEIKREFFDNCSLALSGRLKNRRQMVSQGAALGYYPLPRWGEMALNKSINGI